MDSKEKIEKNYDKLLMGQIEEIDKKDYLDDGDIELLLDTLAKTKSDKNKKLDNLPGNNPLLPISEEYTKSIDETKELYKDGDVSTILVNPQTGISIPIFDIDTQINNSATISDIFEEKKYSIDIDTDKQSLIDTGLSEDDATVLLGILIDYEKDKSIKIYDRLPPAIKVMISNSAPDDLKFNKNARESVAKDMIEYFRGELVIDKEFNDLQTSLANEMEFPDLISSYTLHIKNIMEVELINKAILVEDTNPELSGRLRKISETYIDTYTFKRIIKKIHNKNNIKKELDRQLDDYPKIIKKFSAKYAHSKFTIDSISLVAGALDRHINKEKYEFITILKFIILFCNICKGYDNSDPFEHTFMYYTIKNILSLDNANAKDTEFYKEIIENISSVLDLLQ